MSIEGYVCELLKSNSTICITEPLHNEMFVGFLIIGIILIFVVVSLMAKYGGFMQD